MEHFVFLESGRDLTAAYVVHYDYFLVFLSFAIAILASYTAFLVSERISVKKIANKERRPIIWAVFGSLALGTGVWTMHFIGMLAASIPTTISYDITITIYSLIPAVLASLVLLYNNVSRDNMFQQLLVRSIVMGSGIGLMHYIGMAAMRMDAIMRYDLVIVLFSVVVAVALSYASLRAKVWAEHTSESDVPIPPRLVGSIIMGGSIACMHYTGMAGVYMFPAVVHHAVDSLIFPPDVLAEIIGVVVTGFLLLLISAVVISRRLELLEKLKLSEERIHSILENVGDAIISINTNGIVKDFNKGAEKIFGYDSDEVIGKNVNILMPSDVSREHDSYLKAHFETGISNIIGKGRLVEGVKKDGAIITLDSTVSKIEVNEKTIFIGLLRDVTDKIILEAELEEHRHHLEQMVESRTQELIEARNAAVEANSSKSQFLANMSHELRTPMNSIIGFTGRVIKKSGDVLKERQLNNLRTVERNAHHLLSLINSLLDLSKIEAGKMDVFVEDFKVHSLMKEVSDLTETLFQEKNLELILDISDEDMIMHTDKMKLKQVMINLVGNSIKFTDQGHIKITTKRVGDDKLLISVSDTGAGMSEEEMTGIFEAFKQVDGSMTRKVGGTGLGLTVTRKFIELLGGKIEVESTKDSGSNFTITLPLSLHNQPSKPELAEVEKEFSALQKGNLDRPAVLCIDDDVEALDLLQGYLSDEGYAVITTSDGEEGLRLAKKYKPFAITLDVHMPKIDGWSVLREIKRDDTIAEIPVVMVTMMENKALGYELGATDYLQKPIEPNILLGSIKKILSKDIKTVLAVDDEPDVLELIKQVLEDESINVITATNGAEAIDVLTSTKPDLILLDLMMPVMDGFEFSQRLRKNTEWSSIPVIIVTAKTLTDNERDMLSRSARSIIAKQGMTTAEILQEIASAIQTIKEVSE